jgi:hypothetical protein
MGGFSLYKLAQMYQVVEESLALTDGEITPEIERLLEEINSGIDEKLTAIAVLIKNGNCEVEAIKAEEKRLKERRQAAERRIARLGELVQQVLPVDKTWTSGVHKLFYRASTAIEITDETALPAEYLRTKVVTEPDKVAIKRALESEVAPVPGAVLVTRYNVQVK